MVLRSTSYTVKANDFNVKVKDFKCLRSTSYTVKANDFNFKVKDF